MKEGGFTSGLKKKESFFNFLLGRKEEKCQGTL